jgi:hypothetical protein
MTPPAPCIPAFRDDGYLPEGLYIASEAEVTFRFGSSTKRRQRLTLRLRQWIELCRAVGCKRLLIDGSYVTVKARPHDIDAVVLLPSNFTMQVSADFAPAVKLEEMLLTRRPEELFAAEDDDDWQEWFEFFSRTREPDGCRKGLVEIEL